MLCYAYSEGSHRYEDQNGSSQSFVDLQELFTQESVCKARTHLLWAWSMGVWAAEQCKLPDLAYACAVNGTARPVDDSQGIPKAIFEGTLQGLNELSLKKFRRRMCGTSDLLADFMLRKPDREVDDLRNELAFIGENAGLQNPFPKVWTEAWIAEQDAIFPAQHMKHYWTQRCVRIHVAEGPHYPFYEHR